MERKKIYEKTLKIKGNDREGIEEAARRLRDGEVVAFADLDLAFVLSFPFPDEG